MYLYLRKFIKFIANLVTPIETTQQIKKWEFKNKLLRLAKIHIGQQVAISSGFECITGNEEHIFIDDHVAIGHNVRFYAFNKLSIGSYSTLAADVRITNGGHDVSTLQPFSDSVTIGRGCWIGQGARIVRPVTIGDNVIIAAGAVVTKDIPANSIAVGVPAKVARIRNLPEKVWFLGNRYFCPKTFQAVSDPDS